MAFHLLIACIILYEKMKDIINNYRIFRVLSIFWMVTIFYLSSRPKLPVEIVFYGMDKVLHIVCFGFLGFLFAFSFRPHEEKKPLVRVILITLMVAFYGGLDEFHQSFVPGRDANLYDVTADTIGGLISGVIFRKR